MYKHKLKKFQCILLQCQFLVLWKFSQNLKLSITRAAFPSIVQNAWSIVAFLFAIAQRKRQEKKTKRGLNKPENTIEYYREYCRKREFSFVSYQSNRQIFRNRRASYRTIIIAPPFSFLESGLRFDTFASRTLHLPAACSLWTWPSDSCAPRAHTDSTHTYTHTYIL